MVTNNAIDYIYTIHSLTHLHWILMLDQFMLKELLSRTVLALLMGL